MSEKTQVVDDQERDLLVTIAELRRRRDELERLHSENSREILQAEQALIDWLVERDRDCTGNLKGVGYVTLVKPSVKVSYLKDDEEKVFQFVKESGRDDLIKTRISVHPATLSSFIKAQMESGARIPEYIKCIWFRGMKFYKDTGEEVSESKLYQG